MAILHLDKRTREAHGIDAARPIRSADAWSTYEALSYSAPGAWRTLRSGNVEQQPLLDAQQQRAMRANAKRFVDKEAA